MCETLNGLAAIAVQTGDTERGSRLTAVADAVYDGPCSPVDDLIRRAVACLAAGGRTERTPRVAVALLEVVRSRFRKTTLKRTQFPSSDTMARVAVRVLALAERYGEPSNLDCRFIDSAEFLLGQRTGNA